MNELEQIIESSPRLSARTKSNYLRAVRRFVAFAGSDWTGFSVERWRDHMVAQGLAPSTVNLNLAGLRYAARRRAELSQNPTLDFARYAEKLHENKTKKRRALTIEDGYRFIAACEGEDPRDLRDTAIAVLGFRTGLRRAGICGIEFADLRSGSVEVTLKGGRRHQIPLDDETGAALSDWIGWLRKHKIKSGKVFRSLSKPTLSGIKIGDSLSSDGLYKAMKSRAKKAGIEGFHPHIFRHTCVSWLRQQNVPGWRIAQLTGHRTDGTDDSVMVNHYTTDLSDAPVSGYIPSLRKH